MISAIILTYNEELHIERCIINVFKVADEVIIVDSFSKDNTVDISKNLGAVVYQNPFVNQAKQFQWALDNVIIKNDWILRIDADEYLTSDLTLEIMNKLSDISDSITGIYFKRRVHFMGQWIKHGGYYPTYLLRLWRKGVGSIEQRWMDEHVILNHGGTISMNHDFIDDNLNNMNWWIEKHNGYSLREAVEFLIYKYNFTTEIKTELNNSSQEGKKRKLKNNYYNRLPLLLRPFIYFFYRYIIKLGFLDGKRGFIWHILQGFWYRFLVDTKIYQIERISKESGLSIPEVLDRDFGIKIK